MLDNPTGPYAAAIQKVRLSKPIDDTARLQLFFDDAGVFVEKRGAAALGCRVRAG
jgi:hypothetical protein